MLEAAREVLVGATAHAEAQLQAEAPDLAAVDALREAIEAFEALGLPEEDAAVAPAQVCLVQLIDHAQQAADRADRAERQAAQAQQQAVPPPPPPPPPQLAAPAPQQPQPEQQGPAAQVDAAAASMERARASLLQVLNARGAAPPVEVPLAYLTECTAAFDWTERGLGEGAFGRVFRGVDPVSGARFAVKKLKDELVRPGADAAALAAMHRAAAREVQVLSRFRHPHIVSLIGFAFAGADRCLVYELLPRGALDATLQDDGRAHELTWRVRVRVAAGVAKALNYLHRGGGGDRCFHRDVKAANICLHADLSPALIDCGLAKHIPAEAGGPQTSSGGRFGTPGYMCPRYANGGAYDNKSEAYSFGIVLLELITGEVQNGGRDLYAVFIEDEDEELAEAFDGRAGEWPAAVKQEICAVACDCLSVLTCGAVAACVMPAS